MQHATRNIAVAIFAVLALAGIGAAVHAGIPPGKIVLAAMGTGLFGTIVVPTFLVPNTGTFAPTAAQVSISTLNTVVAQAVFADADTVATITHNLNISAADIAKGYPRITPYLVAGGTFPVMLAFVQTFNSITVNKPSTAVGSAGTWVIIIDRPHSFIR
jgi:hypothetical protein